MSLPAAAKRLRQPTGLTEALAPLREPSSTIRGKLWLKHGKEQGKVRLKLWFPGVARVRRERKSTAVWAKPIVCCAEPTKSPQSGSCPGESLLSRRGLRRLCRLRRGLRFACRLDCVEPRLRRLFRGGAGRRIELVDDVVELEIG